jgi:hypothetical protein
MSPNNWGPPIWTFFHVLTFKIKEDSFSETFPQLFNHIKNICRNLPCPDCSQHANHFMNKVNPYGIQTKTDFQNIIFIFHNIVNQRKGKPAFEYEMLSTQYSDLNLIQSFNNFVQVFHTKGNMKLLADSFQRKLILNDFKKWILENTSKFTL